MAITFDFNSVYSSVKDALSNNQRGGNPLYNERLKLKSGGTYRFRILPYTKEGVEGQHKTVRRVTKFYWTDENGNPKSVVSLMNTGSDVPCPVASYYSRVSKTGTEMDVAFLKKTLRPSDNWLYNVYVLEDTINKENVGKVKILAAGRKIEEIIDSAMAGKYDKKFAQFGKKDYHVGPHVFDISENGVDLVIEVKTKNGYNNYDETAFVPSSDSIPLEALEQCFDLSQIDPVLPPEDIRKIFNDSYLSCVMSNKTATNPVVEKDSTSPTAHYNSPASSSRTNDEVATEVAVNEFLDEFADS